MGDKFVVTPQHLVWLQDVFSAKAVTVDHLPNPVHVNPHFMECLREGLIRADVRYTLTEKGLSVLRDRVF